MKLLFLVIVILINFFNHSLLKSEEKIDSKKYQIENIAKKESRSLRALLDQGQSGRI